MEKKLEFCLLLLLVALCGAGSVSKSASKNPTTTATATAIPSIPKADKLQKNNANTLTSTTKPLPVPVPVAQQRRTQGTSPKNTNSSGTRSSRQVQLLYSPYLFPNGQSFNYNNYPAGYIAPSHISQEQRGQQSKQAGVGPQSPQYAFWSNLQTVPAQQQQQSHLKSAGQPSQSQLFQVYPQFHIISPYQLRNQNQNGAGAAVQALALPYAQVEHGNIWNFDDSLKPQNSQLRPPSQVQIGSQTQPKRNAALSYYFPFANAQFGLALDEMTNNNGAFSSSSSSSSGTRSGSVSKHTLGFQRGNIEARPGVPVSGYNSGENLNLQKNGQYGFGNHVGGFVRAHVESPPSTNNNNDNGFKRITGQNGGPVVQGNFEGAAATAVPQVSFNRGAVEGVPNGARQQTPHQAKNIDDYSNGYQNFRIQTGQEEKNSEYLKHNDNSGNAKKVVCYFANWAWYRKGKASFLPEHIDPMLCTHVIYAFSTFDKATTSISPSDAWTDVNNTFYRRTVALKEKNPDLKVLLSVGGWADSGDDKYSKLAHSPTGRVKFAQEAVKFLKTYGFDGLAVDWHYPKCWQSNCDAGPASDNVAFGDLLRVLRQHLQPENLLLSATLSGYKEVIDLAYHVPTLNELLDLMNVMVYDYHGAWEQSTGHVAPLFYGPAGYDHYPYYNANFTMEYYASLGADRSKLIMGIPMYGQTFTLAEKINTQVGAEAIGPGNAGEHTQQPGMLAYYEICQRVRDKGWTVVNDRTASWGPIAYSDAQWVGYDDPAFVARKARYIQSKGFGGAFVWTMDLDDFNNDCCQGSQPLLRTIAKELLNIPYDSRRENCARPPAPVTPAPVLTTTFRPTGLQNMSEPGSPMYPPGVAPGPGLPCQSSSFSLEPSPNDCSSYYQCANDQLVEKRCSSGLHYNAVAQTCDWPENARCNREPQDSEPSTPRPRPTMLPTMTMTTTRPTLSTTMWPIASHPTTCADGEYLPAEECDSYYLCLQGRKTLHRCGPGLHWDRMRKLCDWPSEAKCQPTANKLDLSIGLGIREQGCSEGSYSSSNTDCSQYFVCVHGENVPFNCQGGLYWNQNSKNCDWPSNAGCDLGAPSAPGQGLEVVTMAPGMVEGAGMTMTTTRQPTMRPRPTTMATMPTSMRPPTRPPPVISGQGSNELLKSDFMLVCYFTNWAWYRQGHGKYTPDNINQNLCTHVVYGFAVLDVNQLTMKVYDDWADVENRFYEKVVALKAKGIKVSIAIGGWNDSEGDKYSRMVNNAGARARFVQNVLEFIARYNFDGLDLDWEYPKCWQVDCDKGPASDKSNFAALVRELKEAFRPHGYLLSAAVSPSKTVIDQGYDVPTLSRYLDWIAVMTYDYHGQWDKKTGHVAPLYFHEEADVNYFNTNYTINYWINQGADRRKIVMGMPLYGQSFTLVDANEHGLNAPASGGGIQGPYTRQAGFLAYYEICHNVQRDGWTVVQDDSGALGPYAYRGNQWVSFDDVSMIAKKSQLIRDLNLGGGMVWALDLDDFRNTCGQGEYPLLTTIKNVLSKTRYSPDRFVPVSSPSTAVNFISQQKQQQQNQNLLGQAGQGTKIVGAQPPKKFEAPEQYVENDVCEDEPYKAHEKDCNKYYQCIFGRYIEQRCPPGTNWNKDRCDWECGTTMSKPVAGSTRPPMMSTRPPMMSTRPPMMSTTMTSLQTTTRTTSKRPPAAGWTQTTTPGHSWTPTTTGSSNAVGPNDPVRPLECPGGSGKKPDWEPATATETNTASPVKVPDSEYKMVCYFTNWAWYRPGVGKYKPSDIDFNLCTHVAYGFAVLDGTTLTIKPHDSWADLDNKFYRQVVQLKSRGLKVVLAIGGWNDSLGDKYSRLVNDPAARRRFVQHMVEFLERHCFDGLDLDWEYPKCWQVECSKGPDSDKQGFADLVRELSEAFKPRGLLLSSAVSPSKTVVDMGYDVPAISKYMDWISVMTYDYHGQWDKKTGHVAPFHLHEEADNVFFNTNYTINYWISQGADRKKIIMGMPMYGQSFTLVDSKEHGLNSKTSGGGTAGEFTRQSGFLAYYEICRNILSNNWEVVQDPSGALGPYAYKGNQWASFDDMNMIRRKSEYIKEMGLGGGMIWALDLDDFRGNCGCGRHPLLKTINRVLRNYPNNDQSPSCRLS